MKGFYNSPFSSLEWSARARRPTTPSFPVRRREEKVRTLLHNQIILAIVKRLSSDFGCRPIPRSSNGDGEGEGDREREIGRGREGGREGGRE